MLLRLAALVILALVSLSAPGYAAKKAPAPDTDIVKPTPELEAASKVPLVQDNLAVIYAEGRGVPQDFAKAAEWFRKSADQGDAFAQYSLAYLYTQGLGVVRDYSEAAKWYYKAAIQGDARSQYHLGTLYYLGMGVPKSQAKAVDWFAAAAKRGDPKAKYYLTQITHPARSAPHSLSQASPFDAVDEAVSEDTSHTPETGLGLVYLQGAGASVGFEAAYFWIAVPLMTALSI